VQSRFPAEKRFPFLPETDLGFIPNDYSFAFKENNHAKIFHHFRSHNLVINRLRPNENA
jgi:hypothetical protein